MPREERNDEEVGGNSSSGRNKELSAGVNSSGR